MWSLLTLVHLVGLALGVGAATVKLVLLLRSRADPSLVPAFLRVALGITRLIVLGLVLLVVSGIGWLLLGHPWTPLLVVKLVLVAVIFVLGPVIDKVAEPAYRGHAPGAGQAPSAAFRRAERRYLALEIAATALLYVVLVVWTLG